MLRLAHSDFLLAGSDFLEEVSLTEGVCDLLCRRSWLVIASITWPALHSGERVAFYLSPSVAPIS